MRGCPDCAEKDEEIAFYKGELGQAQTADLHHRLARAMVKGNNLGRPQTALLVARLFAAKVSVSNWQLLEAVSPLEHEEVHASLVKTLVYRARRSLGYEAIETLHGFGYRLTDTGRAQVATILEGAP